MRIIIGLAGVFMALWASQAIAATATATLQVVWPENELGLNEEQVEQKALDYLHSDEFHAKIAEIPRDWRAAYSLSVGVKVPDDTAKIARQIAQALTVTAEQEQGVITITASNPQPDLALKLAERASQVATNESRFRVVIRTTPEIAQIQAQMEEIQDQIQSVRSQKRIGNQMASAAQSTGTQGANIGAPRDMGRVANFEAKQNRANQVYWDDQIKRLRAQYQELNKQLNAAVQQEWKTRGDKIGLILIDRADLDAASAGDSTGAPAE